MKIALRLARRGIGWTSPNPMVGAVIVKDDRIIGRGYHRRFGGKHAEINAIESTGEDVSGATIYVTLEPCNFYGKTPPCTEAIIKHNIGKVVIGTLDPNPKVKGKSIETLNERGIETEVGTLGAECRELNETYFKYMTTGTPFVTVKYAQTLDGRIAALTGHSQWISSPSSLRFAHRLRSHHDAEMVGIGTVIADDPRLTVRLFKGRSPARIVLDSTLRISTDASILADQEIAKTIIVTTPGADGNKLAALRDKGIEVLTVPEVDRGKIDPVRLLKALGERGFSSLLVEGGAGVITSLIRLKLADRLVAITAPKIMGKGIEAVGDLGIKSADDAIKLSSLRTYKMGQDIVFDARF